MASSPRTICRTATLLSTLALTSTAAAAPAIFWGGGMKDGMTDDYMWFDGGSDNGLFGAPTVVGNTLIFTPSSFFAHDTNGLDGLPAVQNDRLEVTIMAKPGQVVTDIIISEVGDYSIVEDGTVTVSGGLFVTNLTPPFDPLNGVQDDSLVSTPLSPISGAGSGNWSATAGVTLDDWTKFTLVLNNDLTAAASGTNASARIDKKGSAIIIEIVPEPSSLALVLVGAGMLARRRR